MISKLVLAAAFTVAVGSAVAQLPPQGPPGSGQPLTCGDFQHNANGSWTPLKPITINGVSMGQGVSFTSGVSMGGVNLGALLDRQCLGASPNTPVMAH